MQIILDLRRMQSVFSIPTITERNFSSLSYQNARRYFLVSVLLLFEFAQNCFALQVRRFHYILDKSN